MNFDPFANSTSKPKIKRQSQNFVEALKSIGGHTLQSVNQDVIGGFGRDLMSGVFGGPSQSPDAFPNNNPYSPDYLKAQEQEWQRQQEKQQRHREILNATPLYDRREEEIKKQIQALQNELKALAKDLQNLSLTTQAALNEEVAHPGQYHVNFFEKLRRFIITLRKQVADANNWLDLSYQRRQAKQHYWGGVRKGGTKFMLSQERYMATSAG